jgi:hypothetical protein
LDQLLARALETGEVPPDATAEERAELVTLLAQAAGLRLNAARVHSEASASMPTARARFQRHVQAQEAARRPAVPALAAARPGILDRLLAGRFVAFATSAAAVAVVAIVAILVLQPFSDPETASALEIDDYVQLEAVVSETRDGTVVVQAPDIGNLEVALNSETAITAADGGAPGALKRGDSVLVSGVVTAKRAIAATNVSVAPDGRELPGGEQRKIPLLKDLRPGLEGTIRLLSLSPDGRQGRVLLIVGENQLLVAVDPASMDQFLSAPNGGVGAHVRVVAGGDLPKGVFRLEVIGRPSPQPGAEPRPQFENVRGVVIGRTLNVLQVRTDKGVIPVVVRPLTSIRFGSSGLTPEDIRAGESVVGWEIAITGNLEAPDSRRVLASIIVVLERVPARPAGQ